MNLKECCSDLGGLLEFSRLLNLMNCCFKQVYAQSYMASGCEQMWLPVIVDNLLAKSGYILLHMTCFPLGDTPAEPVRFLNYFHSPAYTSQWLPFFAVYKIDYRFLLCLRGGYEMRAVRWDGWMVR